jgi:hypothetical protein
MRRCAPSQAVPAESCTDIGTFQGVVSLVLRDGQITREEKRLVIKLAGLLDLPDEVPKQVYDAVVDGGLVEGGRELSAGDRLRVYAGLFETAFLNASISEDEYVVVAYLRHFFDITEEEHAKVVSDLQMALEEHVEKNMFRVVEKGFDQALDKVNGWFLKIRSILPEGGR